MTEKRSPTPNSHLSLEGFSARESYRNRQILLNKVRNYWLKGVLEKSLHGKAPIELGLEERLDAIEGPLGRIWETADEPRQSLPDGTRIIDKFDELGEGRSLLILGEPGSGKTTMLLELACDLIERAEQEVFQPIPVVLNLSSWIQDGQTLTEWLVEELHSQYQLSKAMARAWLEAEQLLLMLDGLDEVGEQHRVSCVQALNTFAKEHGSTEIVACSRIGDYETLPERLRFQSAIYIKPLTLEQVHHYVAEAGSAMTAFSTVLEDDAALQELATTPLMLNIMTLAYQGIAVEDLPSLNSIEERRKHLFNAYIRRMLDSRKTQQPYSPAQMLHWLSEMAYRMSQESQTVLLIERLQPSWLQINFYKGFRIPFLRRGKRKTQAFQMYAKGVQMMNGLVWGVIIGFFILGIGEPSAAIGSGLIGGLIAGLMTPVEPIQPVESLQWSWGNTKKGLLFGLLFGVSGWLSGGLFWGLVLGLSSTVFSGLLGSVVEKTTVPNQGIWQSLKNAIAFTLIGLVLCLTGGAGVEGASSLPAFLNVPIFTGGIVGLILGLTKGGKACIQHFMLRVVLSAQRYTPWNYAHFLNYAAERTFLQKVGGGYIFIHRLLQDYFANLAIENHLQTFQVSPNDAEAYLQRGNAYANIGDNQRAIEDYTRAIEINSDLVEAYAGRSQARYKLGEYEGVIEDYDRTVELNPHLAKTLTYTTNALTYSGREALENTIEDANSPYLVILLNDNSNTFPHVQHCLMRYIPGMTSDRAWHFTHKVHREGQAVVWSGRQELAALYRLQLSQAGLSIAFLEQAAC